MAEIVQHDFSGGLNMFHLTHAIGENEYSIGNNLRIRDNSISTIKAPTEPSGAPSGKKQALYGFDEFLILACEGRLWYKDTSLDGNTWVIITGVRLLSGISRVYMQAVPATPKMMSRKLAGTNAVGTSATQNITVENTITVDGFTSGVVVQDGTTQPYFIYKSGSTLTSRQLNNYSQWSTSNREYVPVGKQMAYMNGILFIAASDGKSFYRSTSVCPIDFVVNITSTGAKGGDATTTEHSCSPYAITNLQALSSGELLVGTLERCYPLEFDYNNTIFQEPTFLNRKSFVAGIAGSESFVEILGDYAFVDTEGMRSFNAVSNITNEGRNSIFSLKVSRLFQGKVQDDTACAHIFDNYAFFSVNTIEGYIVLIYDQLMQKWVSIDKYGIDSIKQFASTKLDYEPTLYAITADDKVYELFKSTSWLDASVSPRQLITANSKQELQIEAIDVVFDSVDEDVTVTATDMHNGFMGKTKSEVLEAQTGPMYYPMNYPIGFVGGSRIKNHTFNWDGFGTTAFKVGALLQWSGDAQLIMMQFDARVDTYQTSLNQQRKLYAS